MAHHEDVAMIVSEAAALREFAVEIRAMTEAFDKEFAEAEAKARACKYPIREFRTLAPSIKVKIVIPEPVNIAPAPRPSLPLPPADAAAPLQPPPNPRGRPIISDDDLLTIPAHSLRRT